MICEHCKKEIKVEPKQFGKLIVRPIEQFNTAFKGIKIPEGWRIPTLQEGIDLCNNPDFVKWSKFDDGNHNFYVQQPFKVNKKYAAWLGCYDGELFYVGTYYDLDISSAVRGVLLVKVRR